MAHRLDIELTSSRDDGTWTWRAAGAKQPKGTLDGSLLPEGVGIGDVVKAEADATLDGLDITLVLPPKAKRKTAETLELLGSGRNEPLVTSQLTSKGRGRGRDARSKDRRRDGDQGRGRGRDGDQGRGRGRDGDQGRGRDRGRDGKGNDRRPRQERPRPPARPKAPRLRPARTHRQAALAALPRPQQALAEEVLKGGVPGVRQAIERMNDKAAAEGMPKVKSEPLVALAEKLAPGLKSAEWRDRAEAAIAGIDTVDVKDIRSVVVAADSAARDEESRALADQLRDGLTRRVEAEHRKWLDELAENLAEGRTVRALRLSSRPPKAGAPLPPDMAERLAAAASASLTSEVSQDRWATVLDAVAFSPVRSQVAPESLPASPGDQLLTALRKVAGKVPQIAAALGVEAQAPRRRSPRRSTPPTPPPPPPPPLTEPAVAEAAVADPPLTEPAVAEAAVADPPLTEPAVAEAALPDTTDGGSVIDS